jgi:hydrogenase maturation factor
MSAAVSIPSGTYHIVSLSGLALDIISESVAKDSYPLKALKLNRCAFQKWQIEPRDIDDVFAIRWDGAQPRVIRPDGSEVRPGIPVLTALPARRDQEHWLLKKEARTGHFAIVHQPSGYALSLREKDPSEVILDEWLEEPRQYWQLLK